jgi:hypothetical protein
MEAGSLRNRNLRFSADQAGRHEALKTSDIGSRAEPLKKPPPTTRLCG